MIHASIPNPEIEEASVTGGKFAMAWILGLALNTVLALRTFKIRLASEGMAADQALARASGWEWCMSLSLLRRHPHVFL